MIWASRGLLLLWILLAAANIFAWPFNRYEWMLDEPNAVRDGLTYCTLPIDTEAGFMPVLAGVPVLLTLAVGGVLALRRGRIGPVLAGGGILLTLWLVRFLVLRPGC